MTGTRPSLYWSICWRYIAPAVMIVVFLASIGVAIFSPPGYNVWDKNAGKMKEEVGKGKV